MIVSWLVSWWFINLRAGVGGCTQYLKIPQTQSDTRCAKCFVTRSFVHVTGGWHARVGARVKNKSVVRVYDGTLYIYGRSACVCGRGACVCVRGMCVCGCGMCVGVARVY